MRAAQTRVLIRFLSSTSTFPQVAPPRSDHLKVSLSTMNLFHYDRPMHHAQHYMGFTDDLDARTSRHLIGSGGRLPVVFSELGISFTIAGTWEGDRTLERKLKRRKNGRKLCPICKRSRHGKLR